VVLFRAAINKCLFGTTTDKEEIDMMLGKGVKASMTTDEIVACPGCYKIDIGSVKEVFGDTGILTLPTPDLYDPDMRVYKIGKAVDISKRFDQHRTAYAIDGVTMKLIKSYVLAPKISDRAYTFERMIHEKLKDLTGRTMSYMDKRSGRAHTEIFILTGNQTDSLETYISSLNSSDIPAHTINEMEKHIARMETDAELKTQQINYMEISLADQKDKLKEKDDVIKEKDQAHTTIIKEKDENLNTTKALYKSIIREKDEKFTLQKEVTTLLRDQLSHHS
jgi:hypothetical protein